jgi:Domain of unknown function (DUF4281)
MQTRSIIQSPVVPLLLAGAYAALLVHAYHSGLIATLAASFNTTQPVLTEIAKLFKYEVVTTAAWLHLLCLDFCQARCVCGYFTSTVLNYWLPVQSIVLKY